MSVVRDFGIRELRSRQAYAVFGARQHEAEHALCYCPSVCLSVCPPVSLSHGWIRQKRLKLGSGNIHRKTAQSLFVLQYKFNPEIQMGSPSADASNKGGWGKQAIF